MGPDPALDRWLGWRQVHDLTGLGRTTAWRMRQDGDFPDPVPISPGRVAWRERDIAAWNATRGLERTLRPPPTPKRPAVPGRRLPEPHVLTGPGERIPGPASPPLESGHPARPKANRRARNAVAAGQLGFDF